MRFIRVRAGDFTMGSPLGEPARQSDERPHRVRVASDFFIGATEVTQRQWRTIMETNPSSFVAAGDDAPVESVTWLEVQEFLRRLNGGGTGRYRLPTEAEWEFACRAGTTTAYATGAMLSTDQANYDGRYVLPRQKQGVFRASTTAVGSFEPNRWGLYDMHGNVWEWLEDDYCPYPESRSDALPLHCDARLRVIRGGSWYFGADSARSALRYTHAPDLRGFSIGFRVVREVR